MNSINKFGVRQRCINGDKSIADLLLLGLHYTGNENYYIYENDFKFLGATNKNIIMALELEGQDCANILLKDIGIKNLPGVVYWSGEELPTLVDKTFQDTEVDEVVIVEAESEKIVGIISANDFYNEMIDISFESEDELICYRKLSHKYRRSKAGLNAYARNINSQHGEDGILKAIFERIGTTTKYAVEFGGWDGIYLSNIRDLIVSQGFGGLFIEGEKDRADNLMKNYEDYPNVRCEAAFVGFRGENTLDKILARNNAPETIDLLSIDIDGYDYHVWDALKNYRPRVVIVEYNPSISNDLMVINPYNESIFMGSSAAALVELGRKKGYSLVAVTQTNLLFVVDEEFDKMEIWDNSLETLRPVERLGDGKYFQTYNGKIVLTGFNRYIWKQGKQFEGSELKILFKDV